MSTDTLSSAPVKSKRQQQADERAYAISMLRKKLRPGDEVTCVLRHCSASGMSRSIDLVIARKRQVESISYFAARAMGDKIDPDNGGIKIQGCGMDMGFALVYNLGRTLWPKGAKGETDGGYALKSRWL